MTGLELHERMAELVNLAEARCTKTQIAWHFVRELVLPRCGWMEAEAALDKAKAIIEEYTSK